jgi:hypothetical protein
MDPQELIRETENLRDFGEEVSEAVAAQFLEALFRTGQSAPARQFVADSRTRFGAQTCIGLAWICYRYQAYELALDLFLTHFSANRGNPKYLAALEFAAQRCNRVAELLKLYHDNAADDRRLYGRIQSLKRRARL